jgi:hypothetical protein
MSRVYTKNAQMQGARGRSYSTYDAKERNAAGGHVFVQTHRGAAFRVACFVASLAKEVNHSLRVASRIPFRNANAAAMRELIRGS